MLRGLKWVFPSRNPRPHSPCCTAEHAVDVIGHLLVLERQSVCIVAEGRRGISMAETLLRSEQFPTAYQGIP